MIVLMKAQSVRGVAARVAVSTLSLRFRRNLDRSRAPGLHIYVVAAT